LIEILFDEVIKIKIVSLDSRNEGEPLKNKCEAGLKVKHFCQVLARSGVIF
jgi:hypothetical protein